MAISLSMEEDAMRLLLAVMIAILWSVEPALASCTQSTVMLPDGRMLFCMTCCSGPGLCNTTCH